MRIDVLDHGYVKFIEAWGHGEGGKGVVYPPDREGGEVVQDPVDFEVGVIEAARQSSQGSFRGWEEDRKLLRYLYTHRHDSPFEFAGMVLEIRAPIFVFREWHRHRTQSYNEMSARYAMLPNLHYIPTVERLMLESGKNKQAGPLRDAPPLTAEAAKLYVDELERYYKSFQLLYESALGAGVPKEVARLGMPVGRYSQMRASANLRNWLAFLTLRLDPNAQWEIRQFAEAVGTFVEMQFPRTWELFRERLSKQ